MPPSLARRYGFAVPAYRGSEQVVEITALAAPRAAAPAAATAVVTTEDSPDKAARVAARARALDPGAVDGAAAEVEAVRSLYWWDGRVQDDAEWRVTRADRSAPLIYRAVRLAARRCHDERNRR